MCCTDEKQTMSYLNDWDRRLPRLDVVDDYKSERDEIRGVQGMGFSFTFGDYVVKSLLGSVDPELDNLDEPRGHYQQNDCCIIAWLDLASSRGIVVLKTTATLTPNECSMNFYYCIPLVFHYHYYLFFKNVFKSKIIFNVFRKTYLINNYCSFRNKFIKKFSMFDLLDLLIQFNKIILINIINFVLNIFWHYNNSLILTIIFWIPLNR